MAKPIATSKLAKGYDDMHALKALKIGQALACSGPAVI